MKNFLILSFLIVTLSVAHAQVQKVVVKPVAVKTLSPLKNLTDSANYAIGISVASFYKTQGLTKLNSVLIKKGIDDVVTKKSTVFDDRTANMVMNNYMSKIQEEKAKVRIDSGVTFLAKNKLNPKVITTASGLQYQIITPGMGPKPTGPTDSVTCNYKGTLLSGFEFDNSYKNGQPITFALDRVIPGWTEGLQLMSVGSKFIFYVPYTLGYGAFDYGPIPGGSMLTFEIELLDVKHKQ